MLQMLRPQLYVIARDALSREFSESIDFLGKLEHVSLWAIDGNEALAVRDHHGREVLRDGSSPSDISVRKLDLDLNKVTKIETFGIYGSFPASAFFAGFVFPMSEERYRMIANCRVEQSRHLILRLHSFKDLGEVAFAEVKDIFDEWLSCAIKTGYHGELLLCYETQCRRYLSPAQFPLPQQIGWEITLLGANEVFFPWLELFFQLRRRLRKTMRVSMDFSYPAEGLIQGC